MYKETELYKVKYFGDFADFQGDLFPADELYVYLKAHARTVYSLDMETGYTYSNWVTFMEANDTDGKIAELYQAATLNDIIMAYYLEEITSEEFLLILGKIGEEILGYALPPQVLDFDSIETKNVETYRKNKEQGKKYDTYQKNIEQMFGVQTKELDDDQQELMSSINAMKLEKKVNTAKDILQQRIQSMQPKEKPIVEQQSLAKQAERIQSMLPKEKPIVEQQSLAKQAERIQSKQPKKTENNLLHKLATEQKSKKDNVVTKVIKKVFSFFRRKK